MTKKAALNKFFKAVKAEYKVDEATLLIEGVFGAKAALLYVTLGQYDGRYEGDNVDRDYYKMVEYLAEKEGVSCDEVSSRFGIEWRDEPSITINYLITGSYAVPVNSWDLSPEARAELSLAMKNETPLPSIVVDELSAIGEASLSEGDFGKMSELEAEIKTADIEKGGIYEV